MIDKPTDDIVKEWIEDFEAFVKSGRNRWTWITDKNFILKVCVCWNEHEVDGVKAKYLDINGLQITPAYRGRYIYSRVLEYLGEKYTHICLCDVDPNDKVRVDYALKRGYTIRLKKGDLVYMMRP